MLAQELLCKIFINIVGLNIHGNINQAWALPPL